jgi:hypothetical protein
MPKLSHKSITKEDKVQGQQPGKEKTNNKPVNKNTRQPKLNNSPWQPRKQHKTAKTKKAKNRH